ncbi:MAG: M18 family aminopeptidase [Clostridiaceae bacterium]
MKEAKEYAKDLISFINKSGSSYQAVSASKKRLLKNGFIEIKEENTWDLKKGGKYFFTKNMSGFIAFKTGNGEIEEEGYKIIGCHSDTPTLRIKPSPEIISENSYIKLNVEVYGAPILNTFLDRPLSIAGRVSLVSDNPLKPDIRLIDIRKPIVIIPNLAIHMNRTVNKGIELNPQKDMLPLLGLVSENLEKNDYLVQILSRELGADKEDILSFDLFLYEWSEGCLLGINEEFISTSKLDDLSSLQAGLEGIIKSENGNGVQVLACFDNEEIGSKTIQGADSTFLSTALQRIAIALGKTKEEYYRALANSFIISSDSAHAVHPNVAEKSDPTNRPIINKGPVVKISANKKYTSDSESIAIYELICRKADIPYQTFVNRSDEIGGSTIGPITAGHLNIKSVDIGTPILAMHSIRELGGVLDHYYLIKLFISFYNL